MITGFNTDVEHDGVVYHVQTEDKGLDSPLILSLVYSGGAILAMLATTMIPEAYEHAGRWAGMATVVGFAVAFGINAVAA